MGRFVKGLYSYCLHLCPASDFWPPNSLSAPNSSMQNEASLSGRLRHSRHLGLLLQNLLAIKESHFIVSLFSKIPEGTFWLTDLSYGSIFLENQLQVGRDKLQHLSIEACTKYQVRATLSATKSFCNRVWRKGSTTTILCGTPTSPCRSVVWGSLRQATC